MTNLSKTFDDNFKKDVNSLIRKGLKKEMPKGAVYSASKKPPEGAREFTTDRGTKYWVPGKKDKEDSKAGQAKPTSLDSFSQSLRTREAKSIERFLDSKSPKVENTKNGYQVMVYSPTGGTYIPQGQPHKSQEVAEKDAKSFKLTPAEKAKWAEKIQRKFERDNPLPPQPKASSTPKQAKPKASSTPKTGYKSFTDAERRSLEKESMESYRNLGSKATDLYEAGTSDTSFIHAGAEAGEILENKMKSGTYDRKAAEKTAMSFMDHIANNLYEGTDKVDPDTYTPKQKREAAKSWVLEFESGYASGEYDKPEEESKDLPYLSSEK